MIDENKIKVSIHMLTYQHSKYIREALESILIQKVKFKYEIVIGDDYSTDGTREILLEYKKKYPEIIKLLFQKKNVGALKNGIAVKKNCSGKYIAFLEGDDYWIDKNKLQTQVDFLEKNPDYSACYHSCEIIGNDKKACKTYRTSAWDIQTVEQYFQVITVIPTASFMIRNLFLNKSNLKYFTKTKYIGDRIVQALALKEGKIKYIDRKMSTYRYITNGTISYSSLNQIDKWKDYVEAIRVQREILGQKYYSLVTHCVLEVQGWIIKEYWKENKYMEIFKYIINEIEIINFVKSIIK